MGSKYDRLPRCSYLAGTPNDCSNPGIGVPPFCRRHFEHILDDFDQAAETRDIGSLLVGLLDHSSIRGVLDKVGQYIDRAARNPPPVAAPGEGYYTEHPRRPPEDRPPPGPAAPPTAEDPRSVLGFPHGQPLSRSIIKARRNQLAELFHPDRGGSDAAMQRVNAAVDQLLSQLP